MVTDPVSQQTSQAGNLPTTVGTDKKAALDGTTEIVIFSISIVALLIITLVTIFRFTTSQDITSILGVAIPAISAIAGIVVGTKVGTTAGKAAGNAHAAATNAQAARVGTQGRQQLGELKQSISKLTTASQGKGYLDGSQDMQDTLKHIEQNVYKIDGILDTLPS